MTEYNQGVLHAKVQIYLQLRQQQHISSAYAQRIVDLSDNIVAEIEQHYHMAHAIYMDYETAYNDGRWLGKRSYWYGRLAAGVPLDILVQISDLPADVLLAGMHAHQILSDTTIDVIVADLGL